jgi:hypothetical protein
MDKEIDTSKEYGTFISEYYGRNNGRTATIIHSWQGYTVVFSENGEKIERRALWDHTRQYAEDACENWVEGIIK